MIELTLPDMTCGHCVRAITQAVTAADPAAKVQADLPTHQVQIESNQPAAAFTAALTEEGYAPA